MNTTPEEKPYPPPSSPRNPIKWTAKTRRGITHLFCFLAEDTDHDVFDPLGAHAIYRRLTRKSAKDLAGTLAWLKYELKRTEPELFAELFPPPRVKSPEPDTPPLFPINEMQALRTSRKVGAA